MPHGDEAAKSIDAVVALTQIDTTVEISVEFDTVEAADAFFDQITSDHLDKGVIAIRSEREAGHGG